MEGKAGVVVDFGFSTGGMVQKEQITKTMLEKKLTAYGRGILDFLLWMLKDLVLILMNRLGKTLHCFTLLSFRKRWWHHCNSLLSVMLSALVTFIATSWVVGHPKRAPSRRVHCIKDEQQYMHNPQGDSSRDLDNKGEGGG